MIRDIDHQEHKVTMTKEVISCRLGIVSWYSFVCGVKCNTLGDTPGNELVLKFSYMDISCIDSEYELIQHAESRKVDHISTVYVSEDLERLSQGLHGNLILDTDHGKYTD